EAGFICRPSQCCCSTPTGSDGGPNSGLTGQGNLGHVARELAAVGQVGELGPDRYLGVRPERAVHVGVNPGYDLVSGLVPRGARRPDLGESLSAVRYVIVKDRDRAGD